MPALLLGTQPEDQCSQPNQRWPLSGRNIRMGTLCYGSFLREAILVDLGTQKAVICKEGLS